jgi:hypothetical protein
MQGNITDFSLAEVLQFIALGRRTGVLEVQVGPDRHRVYFRNGVIVSVNAVAVSVMQVLAEANLAPETALEAALRESQREGRDLGAVLVQHGLVGAATWQGFVQRELERVLYSLFILKEAPFSFQAMAFQPLPPLTLDLPVDRAVLHGSAWGERWAALRPPIASPAAVHAPVVMATGALLATTPTERRVLQGLGRQADVHRAALRAGLGLLETAAVMARLLAAGRVRPVTTG